MIATISLPGSKTFTFRHVKNDTEAREWRTAWLAKVGETQETLEAVRRGLLLTDKEAMRAKYTSGERVYARRDEAGQLALMAGDDWEER